MGNNLHQRKDCWEEEFITFTFQYSLSLSFGFNIYWYSSNLFPNAFLRINVMPRRIPDFPDSFHSWNFLSSIGSGITFLSFAIFSLSFGKLSRSFRRLVAKSFSF